MIKSRLEIGPVARRDIREITLWLRREADVAVAKRFAGNSVATFAKLAETPGLGPPVPALAAGLEGIRKWRVDGFPKVLIFYQPIEGGVRIGRILHSAADWWSLITVN